MGFKYGANYMGGIGKEQLNAQRKNLWSSSQALGTMTGLADKTASTVNPMAEYYMNPEGWKRTQTVQRTGDTTRSFNNALSQSRLRARMSGFGYEQPAEQMGETNIENARASALARIPGDVEAESVPIAFQGMQTRLGSGQQQAGAYGTAAAGQLGIAGTLNPLGYFENAAIQNEQEQARKRALWQSLLQSGANIAGSFI